MSFDAAFMPHLLLANGRRMIARHVAGASALENGDIYKPKKLKATLAQARKSLDKIR